MRFELLIVSSMHIQHIRIDEIDDLRSESVQVKISRFYLKMCEKSRGRLTSNDLLVFGIFAGLIEIAQNFSQFHGEN